MKNELLVRTFKNTGLAAVYIFVVSQVMQNGSKLFGEKDTMLTPFAVLLLFSLSAAVVGGLVFGQTVILFLDGKKSESVKAATYSVGWLALYTALVMILMFLIK